MNQASETENQIGQKERRIANPESLSHGCNIEEVNILYYWDILKRSKLLVFVLTAISTLLGVSAAFIIEPVFEASVTMVPVRQSDPELGIRNLASQLTGGLSDALSLGSPGSVKAEALATLESRGFLTGFIEDEELMSILFNPDDFKKDDPLDIPSLQDAYKKFTRTVFSVNEDLRTKVIKLTVAWKDPDTTADWANMLVARINSQIRKNAIKEAQKSIDYLNRELTKTSILELRHSIYRLIEVQINSIMLAETRSDYVFKIIDWAVPSDPDQFARPNRRQIVLITTILGLGLGVFIAIFLDSIRRSNKTIQGK